MTAALPKKVAIRAEHTGSAPADRAQRLAQQVSAAHEQTKAVVQAAVIGGLAPYGGVFKTSVSLNNSGTATIVTHALGRVPVGYLVTRVRSVTAVASYTVLDGGFSDSTVLWLIAWCSSVGANSMVCDLFIF